MLLQISSAPEILTFLLRIHVQFCCQVSLNIPKHYIYLVYITIRAPLEMFAYYTIDLGSVCGEKVLVVVVAYGHMATETLVSKHLLYKGIYIKEKEKGKYNNT